MRDIIYFGESPRKFSSYAGSFDSFLGFFTTLTILTCYYTLLKRSSEAYNDSSEFIFIMFSFLNLSLGR